MAVFTLDLKALPIDPVVFGSVAAPALAGVCSFMQRMRLHEYPVAGNRCRVKRSVSDGGGGANCCQRIPRLTLLGTAWALCGGVQGWTYRELHRNCKTRDTIVRVNCSLFRYCQPLDAISLLDKNPGRPASLWRHLIITKRARNEVSKL